ncbi:MAG: acyl-CoA synthetase [Ignavibacteriales bacterium]
MNNLQFDWLAKWALYTPNKFFLREYDSGKEWSFSDFNNRANHLAEYLTEEVKLSRGSRLAVYSLNSAEHILLFGACVKAGLVLVPLNFRLTPAELDAQINDANPSLFIYAGEFSDQVKVLQSIKQDVNVLNLSVVTDFLCGEFEIKSNVTLHDIDENDAVMLLYTAGTTGVSKGVTITHKMLFYNAVNTGLRLDINSQDHTQSYAPFFHTGGWNVLFTPFLLHGASHTILRKFDAALILELMEKEKTTLLFGVPTMLQMMAECEHFEKTDLSSVRYAIVGGAAMPIPLIETWHAKGVYIRQGYGLTEVGPNCFSLHQDDAIRKIGSIGFPNFYIDVKIVKDDGPEAGVGEPGELWLKSPVVTPGYWRKPEETAEAITDGWFHTGDIVKRDDEGYFYVVDRKKNMYISGGENVYPAETEKLLYTMEEIKEAAVIGVPDERWGESGKIYAVLNKESKLTASDLIQFCKGKLAGYKIPKHAEIIDEIPKTDAGKINKRELLKRHLNQIQLTSQN